MKKILITGGAGFIGSHLALLLTRRGNAVRILDPLTTQVHGLVPRGLDWLVRRDIEFMRGSVTHRPDVVRSLDGITHVVHLAAETGTGQSMYEIDKYFRVNVQGTATLLDVMQNESCGDNIKSVVVASSRATYGEGAYICPDHGKVYPESRQRLQMSRSEFNPACPVCGGVLSLTPTPEDAPLKPMSVYGLTKQVQEQAVLLFARTRGINGFGLRYQNVYGPGQSLKNPYTGILAVFSNLARQNQLIEIYEDGEESRDFVYIDDVAEATARSIDYPGNFVGALNVGSGQATSVVTVARAIKEFFDSKSSIKVTGAYRAGDIRHNVADVARIKQVLDFVPGVSFNEGLYNFLSWASGQAPEDKVAYTRSVEELSARGLMGKSEPVRHAD